MKSLSRTSLKLASLAALVVLGAATVASAQNPRIQTAQLDALAAKASQTVDVNIDESLMQIAKNFLSNKDTDEVKVKELVNGLKGIYVKSLEFDTEGQFSDSDLEGIRVQLRNSAWNRIVNVSSKKEGSVEVYLMHTGGLISGLALLAVDAKEVTVVNIIGPVDLEKLSELEGQFGIPELNIERSKPKRKN
jgi:polynucleotide 5'-kinase involved in rRNA processing